MPEVRTYNVNDVNITFGIVELKGFADGTFLNVVRDTETFQKVVGADGDVSRIKNNDKTGTITVTLKKTSPSNDLLSAIALEDELTTSGVGIQPLTITDKSGTTLIFAANAWITKPPDYELSKDMTEVPWVFNTGQLDMLIGGN